MRLKHILYNAKLDSYILALNAKGFIPQWLETKNRGQIGGSHS